MGGGSFQIIVLLILAVVIFMRLMRELGKRDGHEPELKPKAAPHLKLVDSAPVPDPEMEVIEGDETADAIAQARAIEPDFRVDKFLLGSKAAYEMILMSFLEGDIEKVKGFVDPAVYEGFETAIVEREKAGHKIEAKFIGIKDVTLMSAEFDEVSGELTLGVEYIAELNRVIYDSKGKVVEGKKNKLETEIDHWQFARIMGTDNPNWELVATGE